MGSNITQQRLMATETDYLIQLASNEEELQASNEMFGIAIRNWFARNEWSQQVIHDWSAAAGTPGVWNSQISKMMNAKLEPKYAIWLSLAAFNHSVAEQEFEFVSDRKLLESMHESEPFMTSDWQVATPMDFISMFMGLEEINPKYLPTA